MKSARKRVTIYLEPHLHRGLKIKAAHTDRPISALVNDAVQWSLREDAADLAAFDERRREPSLAFEDVLKDLKRRGKL